MSFNFLGNIYVSWQILYQIYKLLLSIWLVVNIDFIVSFDTLFFNIFLGKWFFEGKLL